MLDYEKAFILNPLYISRESTWWKPMIVNSEEGKPILKCSFPSCSNSQNFKHIVSHLKHHHKIDNNILPMAKCQTCKRVMYEAILDIHTLTKHSEENIPGKASSLWTSGEKSNKCSFQTSDRKRNGDVSRQNVPAQNSSDIKEYSCDVCDTKYRKKKSLEEHKRKRKHVQCKDCTETFKTKSAMRKHVTLFHEVEKISREVSCSSGL